MRLALVGSSIVAIACLVASPAFALTQPNGASIPSQMGCANNQPTGLLPVFACACTQPGVCNIGTPCASQTSCDDGQHGTCESTMWHSFNDNSCIPTNHSGIDPWKDAAITPETFHPTCALTYTVQSRGTARFQNAFGWYNATTSQAPDPSDLHVMLDCNAAAGSSVVLDLTKEPSWKGGDIGFFLLTPEAHGSPGQCANGNCCPTVAGFQAGSGYVYYSQREWNPDGQGQNPFIHLLIFASTISKQKYYFGWEDTYQTTSADFTDLVTSVSGVDCSGAGQQCDTGQKGICALGVTECQGGAQASCQPLEKPSPEVCDGLDDDCDGQIDNGATCPTAGDICVNGKCVPHCGSLEFPCTGGAECDMSSGLCVPPACVGVKCPAGQICQAGQCGAPCQGVVCPHGQTCLGTDCVDLCGGTKCPSGQVCSEGACVPSCACGGLTCAAPLSCDATSGTCADPSCPNGCPSGTYCQGGACVDACMGAKCPPGQTCQAGSCVGPGGAAGSDGGGLTGPGGSSSSSGAGVRDADGGSAAGGATGSGGAPSSGCACRATGGGAGGVPLGAAAALAFALARRRRVCARRAAGRH